MTKIDFQKIKLIKEAFDKDLKKVKNKKDLDNLKIKYLGKKAKLTLLFKKLKDFPEELRKKFGQELNKIKQYLTLEIEKKELVFSEIFHFSEIDLTKPGKRISYGHLNPLTKLEKEILEIFRSMGFSIVDGPEIEKEYYNFDALNIEKDHPAREMWDTLWLKGKKFLLRTHTSPVQIRYMEKHNPPFAIVAPGRVFRYEATDATHEINFSQLEGLMVSNDISLANFRFVVETFFERLFGKNIDFCFRPAYFPFVEPGIEVYLKLGKEWLEIAGAGMVHRKVFEAVGYNPKNWQGFAFGFGLDRLAMIKYKIPDVRLFYSGDLRFIRQFKKIH